MLTPSPGVGDSVFVGAYKPRGDHPSDPSQLTSSPGPSPLALGLWEGRRDTRGAGAAPTAPGRCPAGHTQGCVQVIDIIHRVGHGEDAAVASMGSRGGQGGSGASPRGVGDRVRLWSETTHPGAQPSDPAVAGGEGGTVAPGPPSQLPRSAAGGRRDREAGLAPWRGAAAGGAAVALTRRRRADAR